MRFLVKVVAKPQFVFFFAASLSIGCGPERQLIQGPGPKPTRKPDLIQPTLPERPSVVPGGSATDLAPALADSLGLRPFDTEGGELGTAEPTRVCDDSNQSDLGITTLRQEWPQNDLHSWSGWEFAGGDGFENTRTETWSRPGGIFCSPAQWVKVGWNDASRLAGLQTQVQIQLNLSQKVGTRETQRFLIGARKYVYAPEGHGVSGKDVTVARTLIIGSPQLPNTVRVALLEGGNEIRRTSGQIYTDPDHPIQEILVRRVNETFLEDRAVHADGVVSPGSVVTVAKTIKSGVILARQADGTSMRTTIENLEYLGRRADGSFSCLPRSGKITDEVSFDLPRLKGVVTVSREASAQGVVLTSQCSAGVSVESCSELIQKSLRQALTPYCLY